MKHNTRATYIIIQVLFSVNLKQEFCVNELMRVFCHRSSFITCIWAL